MDSKVCPGCVLGHVVIVSVPLDGPRAMVELKVLEAKHLRADLDHELTDGVIYKACMVWAALTTIWTCFLMCMFDFRKSFAVLVSFSVKPASM